jgi:quinohemoprotein ethanol dehydrogenase
MRGKAWTLAGAITLAALISSGTGLNAASKKGAIPDTNWSHAGGDSSEAHYSALTQINSVNVNRLGLAWSLDIDTYDSFSAPLMVGGTLYFGVGSSVIHAVDARTGKLKWKYDPEIHKTAGHKMRAGWGIRGIAYADGKVFAGGRDGRLFAVDAKKGKLLWQAQTLDPKDQMYITGAPWIAGDKVVIGFGGSDYGPSRGYVTAYDIKSGKQAWRWHVVPGNPADGFENKAMEKAAKTWTGEWWKLGGGGAVYNAMAYDEKFDTLLIGTGNGFPWNQKIRSPGGGDNLYLSSIVALDRKTGDYKWHYQVNPGNTWDFNNAMDIELTNLTVNGKLRPVLLHAPKNGFFYVIDRENGKLLSAEKFTDVNWAEKIDLETGRPVEHPDARYPDGKPFLMTPAPTGAHGVQSMAYNVANGLAYIPVIHQERVMTDPANVKDWKPIPEMFVNNGLGAPPPGITTKPTTSSLLAWDPARQQKVWQVPQNGMINGGAITTAGNLVFQGLNTGQFVAFAADTGAKLWSFDAQNGIMANAITYSLKGKQYVSVLTGFRSSFANNPNWDYRQQQRRVLTFVLDGTKKLPDFTYEKIANADDPAFVIDPAKSAIGARIYGGTCVICHGAGMTAGGAAPDLRQSGMPLDGAAFASVVREGSLMHRGMPSFTQFSDEELDGLRHYIRQRARDTASK